MSLSLRHPFLALKGMTCLIRQSWMTIHGSFNSNVSRVMWSSITIRRYMAQMGTIIPIRYAERPRFGIAGKKCAINTAPMHRPKHIMYTR